MLSGNHLALIIVGPTASGKTDLSLKLAKHFNTSIISADSRQCFREMNIGTAKPSNDELSQIQHYFINSHSISDHVDAAVFEKYALNAISEIFAHHSIGIISGGTGFYVKTFCEGIDEMPVIDPKIREQVKNEFLDKGVEYLQQTLCAIDPLFMNTSLETKNPSRLMRALEFYIQTGKSIMEFRKGSPQKRAFRIQKIGIQWPKELLYERINVRVDRMLHDGLLNEVEALIPFRNNPSLQTVGYQELFDHIDGKVSLNEAVEKIKQHTRNYAKRQMTWFRKEQDVHWFWNHELEEVIPYVQSLI